MIKSALSQHLSFTSSLKSRSRPMVLKQVKQMFLIIICQCLGKRAEWFAPGLKSNSLRSDVCSCDRKRMGSALLRCHRLPASRTDSDRGSAVERGVVRACRTVARRRWPNRAAEGHREDVPRVCLKSVKVRSKERIRERRLLDETRPGVDGIEPKRRLVVCGYSCV